MYTTILPLIKEACSSIGRWDLWRIFSSQSESPLWFTGERKWDGGGGGGDDDIDDIMQH